MRRLLTAAKMVAFLASGLTAIACGGTNVKHKTTGSTLTGTVKFGGESVPFGLILASSGLISTQGKIGEDGSYRIENVPIGEVLIGVNTEAGRGDFMSKTMGDVYSGPQGGKAKGKTNVKFVDVPAKYADPKKSGFKTNIVAGDNTFDIEIPK